MCYWSLPYRPGHIAKCLYVGERTASSKDQVQAMPKLYGISIGTLVNSSPSRKCQNFTVAFL